MTRPEIDYHFDFFLERMASNGTPALDYQQKSVAINDAMENLIVQTYNGFTKPYGFEQTEKRIEDLGELVRYKTYTTFAAGFLPNSVTVALPNTLLTNPVDYSDVFWFLIYDGCTTDQLECGSLTTFTTPLVKEVSHQELATLLKDPFNKPSAEERVFRNRYENLKLALITDGTFNITSYTIGYVRKPQPIDLDPVNNPQNIGFINISDHLQREIIKKAVSLSLENLGDPRYQSNKAELNTIE